MERSEPSHAERRRVAIVDDAADFRHLLEDVLSDRFDVIALSGEEITVEDLVATRPDLLIIDLRLLPGQLTGIDLLKLVRAHYLLRHVPVVVCSADMAQVREHEAELRAAPHLAILAKPFALDDLDRAIAAAMTGE